MSFKIADPTDTKPDNQKAIVEEVSQVVVSGTFTLTDLEESLVKWKDTLRQAQENIPKIEARITDVKKLFKP